METYSTFEYSSLNYEEVHREEKAVPEESKLYLLGDSIEYLEKLKVAKVFRRRIKFQNYVGVVSFKNLRLEILPKFLKTGEKLVKYGDLRNRRAILSTLIRMLEYSGWVGIKSTELTKLGMEDDFFEIYVHLFARNLSNLLKTRRDASYIREYDELRFVRGRIDFRYLNPASLHKIPCHYYERSMDTRINKTLKYTSYLLVRKIRNPETRRLLNGIISMLDPVTLFPITPSEIDGIVFNRLNSSFKPYIEFCRGFLQNSIPSMQGSDVEFFSFLIPMEVLFERFIARVVEEIVEEEYEGFRVEIQKMSGYLARADGRGLFALRPDIILVRDDGSKVIVDTKYKLLDPGDRKLGVSQQDLYQMYAYCRELDSRECVLLYPETLNGVEAKNIKLGKGREIDLYIRTIPLENPFDGKRLSKRFKRTLKEAIGLF